MLATLLIFMCIAIAHQQYQLWNAQSRIEDLEEKVKWLNEE